MSEMESDYTPDPAGRLHTALLSFTSRVGLALPDICSYGLTVGQSYVPFNPDPEDDCDDEEAMCSQVWVRVVDINEQRGTESWDGGSCAPTLNLTLEVGVLRCFVIPEDGEAPTATEVTAAGLRAMSDMIALRCAALDQSETDDAVDFDSVSAEGWSPSGPSGGQYGGSWLFSASLVG